MPVKCRDIINMIEAVAPQYLALEGDNTGLIIGDEESQVKSILVALDINDNVYNEAICTGANLIITHHPVIYHPVKSINLNSFKGRIIHKLVSSNINVYSAHTNLDAASTGINDFLVKQLGLIDVSLLEKTYEERYVKIVVYVPVEYGEKVREALTSAGAGYIGNYSGCTFNIDGTGTFMPLTGANPFMGSVGTTEFVKEIRIESIVETNKLNYVIDRMLKAHPYEEAAYDIYPLLGSNKKYGVGRVGYLKQPMTLNELSNMIKNILSIESVNVVGDLKRSIKKVGICGGDGADFIENAYNAGCDVYITGDIRYHDACDVRDMGMALIDAGHFATENIYMAELAEYIKTELQRIKSSIDVVLSVNNKNPFVRV